MTDSYKLKIEWVSKQISDKIDQNKEITAKNKKLRQYMLSLKDNFSKDILK